LLCQEDREWAAREEEWVVPEKEWAVRVAAEAVVWEDQRRQVRVANASAQPADTGSPMGGGCRARR